VYIEEVTAEGKTVERKVAKVYWTGPSVEDDRADLDVRNSLI
jgi:hypothetical protein